uniref:Uncharacterized protein n=1 Tax=Laticauda laticaudata TaxID=8630 RepID=A0A8C5RYW6_LATLA
FTVGDDAFYLRISETILSQNRLFCMCAAPFYIRGADAIHTPTCAVNTLHPIYISTASPLFPTGVRDASASSAMHPPLPLCVHCKILPRNPFGGVIHFYLLSSAKLPMNIRLTSPLHTTHVRSFLFHLCKFSPLFGVDENGWSHP